MSHPTLIDRGHRLRRMTGRDVGERHRASSPLELLFDLAFVVAIGQAGNELAHAIAAGHLAPGIGGFLFAMGAICWAWVNFTWFASAYDTDDWFFRVTTMVQMIGVVVFAIGLPAMFASLDHTSHVDNSVMVAGYVVMRVALIVQWLRAAHGDPARRSTALTYAVFVGAAQVGWVIVVILDLPTATFFAVCALLWLVELAGPIVAERRSTGTPWHPHHIAERYGLLAIIALGEGVLGTVAAVAPVVAAHGWSADAITLVVAGIGLTFGMWWCYFTLPSGELLERFRGRAWAWSYGHVFIFSAIAAVGAGLHVAAYVVEGEAVVGVVGATVAVGVPVLVFLFALFGLDYWLVRSLDPAKTVITLASSATIVLAVALAAGSAPLAVCLAVVTVAPAITVIWYEVVGYRRADATLAVALADAAPAPVTSAPGGSAPGGGGATA